MSVRSKVCWFEGLALAPQQFQQQDLYHEARLQHVAAALNPHLWGVRSVEWDLAPWRTIRCRPPPCR